MSNWLNKYSSYLSIPDNWESLNDFANWYIDNKMPIIIPEDSHVYYTELVSSYVMFKHKTFQVEMYVIKPNHTIPTPNHCHPGVDLLMFHIGGKAAQALLGNCTPILKSGQYHGGAATFFNKYGTIWLSIQQWHDITNMTSVSVHWKGETDGPEHIAMILKHRPNAYVNGNYVDSTIERTSV
jgi:hypothetical protein